MGQNLEDFLPEQSSQLRLRLGPIDICAVERHRHASPSLQTLVHLYEARHFNATALAALRICLTRPINGRISLLVSFVSATRLITNSGELPRQVEVIDGHNLPQAAGQLSINPYVVLTLDGHAFARSSTSRGAAFPVWCSEVFMVKLPPPPVGEWHLNPQTYFRGYR